MELKERNSKVSYTVMVVSDSAKRRMKKFHVKAGAVGTVTILIFILLVLNICYIVYSSITLSDSLERGKDQMEQITHMKEENEKLIEENERLSGKITILSETINKKVETEQEIAAEQEENHLPKGFPLNGSAQMKSEQTEDEENENPDTAKRKGILFAASEGIGVVASGTGLVVEVDTDIYFGNVISIDHGNGYISSYRNAGKPMVRIGEEIARGTILYIIGEDNDETEYSIRKNDVYIDPMEMIEING